MKYIHIGFFCLKLKIYLAVPTIKSGRQKPDQTDRSKRMEKKMQKQIVSELLQASPDELIEDEEMECVDEGTEYQDIVFDVDPVTQDKKELQDRISELEKKLTAQTEENSTLLANNHQNRLEIQNLMIKLADKNDAYDKMAQHLKDVNNKFLNLEQQFDELKSQKIIDFQQLEKNLNIDNVKKLLASVLTPNQIDLILNRKRQVHWTQDELSLAFTIRYLSKKCYLFMKSKMKIPLPSISTLQKWASKISIVPGKY